MRTPTLRVLVVDDDEPVRRLIRLNLELEGFEVEQAADGRECLTMVRTNPPDVITLDLVMPAIDGLTAAARLREAEHSRHIPLVLITAAATPRDRVRADEIGIDAVLTKPFAPQDLVATIRRVAGATVRPPLPAEPARKSEERTSTGH
ncbi:response regulator transcription factor [Sporichthya polymorpha]|uniref:response regulator transcription factor n=1 Tax=Sporichthya polymorpha TaxID=35751 RepID=UPI001B7F9A09|nr:response regulator [Sporichthya polymorpha]